MSFSADWLALRRDADDRARSTALTVALADALAGRATLRVLDLGCGTGANMAALASHLPGLQTWVLADNDQALLDRIAAPDGVAIRPRLADLAGDLEALFDPVPDLVTASAFFDLCGEDLADRIVAMIAAAGALFHTALTFDGRETWEPGHPVTAAVLDAFLSDQRRDKGMGPALGPGAVTHLCGAFRAAGYSVQLARSDWELRQPGDAAIIAELARGHADTARGRLGSVADDWLATGGRAARVTIGHRDLLAVPPRPSSG